MCVRDHGCGHHILHNESGLDKQHNNWRRHQDGCRATNIRVANSVGRSSRGGKKRSDLDNHHNYVLCQMADRCSGLAAPEQSGFPQRKVFDVNRGR